ncbi:hypothetical protein SPLC1_S533460 [Arthrospira platensis C1]|nr:hypothetical protein SPLC1_S533460 [Arthrospira platensis C1]
MKIQDLRIINFCKKFPIYKLLKLGFLHLACMRLIRMQWEILHPGIIVNLCWEVSANYERLAIS